MKANTKEILGGLALLLVLIGTPLVINYYSPFRNHGSTRIINLTAISTQGIWTAEKVDGLNIWNSEFKKATIVVHKGEKVILRFTTVDVTHSFYIPELKLGPVFVDAGHLYDVPFQADTSGIFTYFCTSICGHCHFYMQGKFIILDKGQELTEIELAKIEKGIDTTLQFCAAPLLENQLPSDFITRGKVLFETKNCILCHGAGGKGGVKNTNYAKYTIPELASLADKLKIPDKETADSIIKLLKTNTDFEKLSENPPFRTYSRFLAQFNSINQKILNGANVVQKADPLGPVPPLCMPSWEYYLSKEEINAILAYLINQNKWE